MNWTKDFSESDNFEILISKLFTDKMKAEDDFCKDIWSSLANVIWVNVKGGDKYSTSFRSAGGFIAEIIGKGDYMDWYCSGEYQTVSYEIKKTLKRFGWVPYSYEGDKL